MTDDLSRALARRRKLFAEILAERDQAVDYLCGQFPEDRDYLDRATVQVRTAVVVLGSPRGGTSVFKQVLASAPGALALPGEHRLFFTLLGLNYPDHGGSDECAEYGPLDEGPRDFLFRNLLFECRGEEVIDPTPREWERYAWDWALRLRLQWPDLDGVPLEKFVAIARDAMLSGSRGPEPALDVLRALRARGLPINPYYYDLTERMVSDFFPDVPPPFGAPGRTIVEISPFLALRPCRRPRLAAARNVLVLKASSDAYRIPLLHDLFTGWDLRELHLTRNPLAAVNGLIDGWEHRSFWQHDLSAHGTAAGPRVWWNFDLCDGWQELAAGPLEELAARQWAVPHQRILRHAKSSVRFHFEDFQAGGDARLALMARAAGAAGLSPDGLSQAAVEQARLVNSTAAPGAARWRRQRSHLRTLLGLPEVAETCESLGYDIGDWHQWS
jgi:hypothetical protein